MQKTKLVCFAGAGGTGKTTLANALKDRLYDVEIHRSIVREFYAHVGIENEEAFHQKPIEWRKGFQKDLLEYYVTTLTQAYQQCTAKYMICERSVFDHVAYTIFGSNQIYDRAMYEDAQKQIKWFAQLSPVVLYLPYPTPWDHLGEDGFRHRHFGKDITIDAIISAWVEKHAIQDGIEAYTLPPFKLPGRVNLAMIKIESVNSEE